MTLILVALAFLGIGASLQRWWTLALPVSAGGLAAVALVATGRGLGDTPIPFLIILSTAATAGGVVLRRSMASGGAALSGPRWRG